jgi:hypothetical protein
VRLESHTGPRAELRAPFAEAEDSAQHLDSYLDDAEVLTTLTIDLLHDADADAGGIAPANRQSTAMAQRGYAPGGLQEPRPDPRVRASSTWRPWKNAASEAAGVAATVIAHTSSRMSIRRPAVVTGFGCCELTVVS